MAKPKFTLHPACKLLPPMRPEEFESFKQDIREQGVLEPIMVVGKRIIDGRNRYRAWEELQKEGVDWELPYEEFEGGDEDIRQYVMSKNAARRHLSSSQKACVVVENNVYREKLVAKKKAPAGEGDGKREADHVAEMMGTNRSYILNAQTLKQEAPELFDAVLYGEIKLTQAMERYKLGIGPSDDLKAAKAAAGGEPVESDGDMGIQEEPEPILDGMGEEVPEDLVSVFETVDEFDAIGKLLREAKKRHTALAQTEASGYVDVQAFTSAINGLITQVRKEKPYCPTPEGYEGKDNGLGFLSKGAYDTLLKTSGKPDEEGVPEEEEVNA